MNYLIMAAGVIFFASCIKSVDQPLVQMQITQDSIRAAANAPEVSVSFCFKNTTPKNFIFYGFNNFMDVGVVVDDLCDQKKVGAGIAVLVFNQEMERKYARWKIHDSI